MAKLDFRCPITHVVCKDCSLYRGRHYFLPFCRYYRDRTQNPVDPARPAPVTAESFKEMFGIVSAWEDETTPSVEPESFRGGRIKVIDAETDESRYCSLEELKTLDWDNPEQMRILNGCQITSWRQLAGMVSSMMEQGDDEIELYDAPRFMLLGGG